MAMTGQDNYGTIATIEQGQDNAYKAAMTVHRSRKGQQLHDCDDRTDMIEQSKQDSIEKTVKTGQWQKKAKT
jgi:hypothetical protein